MLRCQIRKSLNFSRPAADAQVAAFSSASDELGLVEGISSAELA